MPGWVEEMKGASSSQHSKRDWPFAAPSAVTFSLFESTGFCAATKKASLNRRELLISMILQHKLESLMMQKAGGSSKLQRIALVRSGLD